MTTSTLFILNDAPYGNERAYNALRLAAALAGKEDQAVTVALKQVSETPRRPSTINPTVPPALHAVVMQALPKDPDARYNDARAHLRALDADRLHGVPHVGDGLIADGAGPIVEWFVDPEYVTRATRRLVLYALVPRGVSDVDAEEALLIAAEVLADA